MKDKNKKSDTPLKTVKVKKGKFNLTFDATKIADKDAFVSESTENVNGVVAKNQKLENSSIDVPIEDDTNMDTLEFHNDYEDEEYYSDNDFYDDYYDDDYYDEQDTYSKAQDVNDTEATHNEQASNQDIANDTNIKTKTKTKKPKAKTPKVKTEAKASKPKKEDTPTDTEPKEESLNGLKTFKSDMQLFNVSIFACTFVILVLGLFMLKRPTISETENRALAKFPTFSWNDFWNGTYTADISEWFNDTVPCRDTLKDVSAKFRSMLGFQYDGVTVVNVNGNGVGNKTNYSTETSTTTETTTPTEVTSVEDGVTTTAPQDTTTTATTTTVTEEEKDDQEGGVGELSNNIMIYHKRGIPIYYGDFDNGKQYAQYVNNVKEDLGSSVRVYSMVCPTAMSFYWPENSDIAHGSEEENIQNINDNLVNVTPVNLITTLAQHKSEDIYSRTDHHWQPLGAYYSAQQFSIIANVPFDDISTYDKHVIEDYVGTLYGYSGSIILKENPEDFVYYSPNNEYSTYYYDMDNNYQYEGSLLVEATGSSAYLTFMGGDDYIVHVKTAVKNGRNLVVIKDSYGNALIPFLTGSFENIYVVDMRYFELNLIKYIKAVNGTDVLFAMNTFSATGSNYENLEVLRTQNPDEEIIFGPEFDEDTTQDTSNTETDEYSEDDSDQSSDEEDYE